MGSIKRIVSHIVYAITALYCIAFGVLAGMEWGRLRHATAYIQSQEKPKIDDAFRIDMVVSAAMREELFKNLRTLMPIIFIVICLYLLYYRPALYKGLLLLAMPIIGSAVAMLPFVVMPYYSGESLPIGNTLFYVYRSTMDAKWIFCIVVAIYTIRMLYSYKTKK